MALIDFQSNYFNWDFSRKKVAEHQRAERERAAAAKEAERLRAEVAEAKQRRAELQRTASIMVFAVYSAAYNLLLRE